MLNKINKKKLENFGLALLGIGTGVLVLAVAIFFWKEPLSLNLKINSDKIAHLGDFIGGVVGSFWALSGVILFYIALSEQRKDLKINRDALKTQIISLEKQTEEFQLQRQELEETRQVFKEQSETLRVQRFENTFFQMVSLHHEIIDKLSVYSSYFELEQFHEKRAGLNEAVKRLKLKLDHASYKNSIKKHGQKHLSVRDLHNLDEKEHVLIEAYKEFYFKEIKQSLSSYFRNIYHVFKYIYTSHLIEIETRKQYAAIARAQLSSDELFLIFYNSLCPNLGYPNFLFLVNEFDILQNFDFRLVDDDHKIIFDRIALGAKPKFKTHDKPIK